MIFYMRNFLKPDKLLELFSEARKTLEARLPDYRASELSPISLCNSASESGNVRVSVKTFQGEAVYISGPIPPQRAKTFRYRLADFLATKGYRVED